MVFWETLLSLKPQAHSVVEAIILPSAAMDILPGVFKQELRSAGGEWSTHRKVIDFTAGRPFRMPWCQICLLCGLLGLQLGHRVRSYY